MNCWVFWGACWWHFEELCWVFLAFIVTYFSYTSIFIQPFPFVPSPVAPQGILFLPGPFPNRFPTAYLLAFFSYLQFYLNEFGLLELISEEEAEAIRALSGFSVNANSESFVPAAADASAASSTAWEGEDRQFLKQLLGTGLHPNECFSTLLLPRAVCGVLVFFWIF